MRLLVIEDDAQTASFVARGLTESGHVVDVAGDGREGLLQAAATDYDVLIVDRMLPGLDGVALVRTLRAAGNQAPVLFLTALGSVDHRVEGLRAGGDDYLVKPFAFTELLARIDALARRRGSAAAGEPTRLKVGDLEMDLLARTVRRAGQPIELQPREFKLLEALMRAQGRVMTRTMLLEKVWDYSFDPQTNVIDVHISRLRQKIDREFEPALIQTIRGAGYALRPSDPTV